MKYLLTHTAVIEWKLAQGQEERLAKLLEDMIFSKIGPYKSAILVENGQVVVRGEDAERVRMLADAVYDTLKLLDKKARELDLLLEAYLALRGERALVEVKKRCG